MTPEELEAEISRIAGPEAAPADRALLARALAEAAAPPRAPALLRRDVERLLRRLPSHGRRAPWAAGAVAVGVVVLAGGVAAWSAPMLAVLLEGTGAFLLRIAPDLTWALGGGVVAAVCVALTGDPRRL